MYLQDVDETSKSGVANESFKSDHVLFREINSERTKDEQNSHSANKIYRNQKNVPVVIRCNCGKYHPLFENNNLTKAKWFMSLCQNTKDILISGELTYLQTRTKLLAEME